MNWWIPLGTTGLYLVGWVSGYFAGREDAR